MPRRRNPLVQGLATGLSIAFGRFTARLPLGTCRALGRLLGGLAYYVVPRIRRVGLANLDLAYGDTLTRAEKVRILKQAAQNVGVVTAEFSHIPEVFSASTSREVTFDGLDQVDPAQGALAVGAHLGNWEWLAPSVAACGRTAAAVARPLDHPKLNAFVDGIRRSTGAVTVPKDHAGHEMVRLLKEGYIVGLLLDQSPRDNAVPTRFFGCETWSTIGASLIAARAGVPIHPVAMIRGTDGRYVCRFRPALPQQRSGSTLDDLVVNTQRCQDAVEQTIRAYPGQWLWFHRRWKARPRLEREWAARQAQAPPVSPSNAPHGD